MFILQKLIDTIIYKKFLILQNRDNKMRYFFVKNDLIINIFHNFATHLEISLFIALQNYEEFYIFSSNRF